MDTWRNFIPLYYEASVKKRDVSSRTEDKSGACRGDPHAPTIKERSDSFLKVYGFALERMRAVKVFVIRETFFNGKNTGAILLLGMAAVESGRPAGTTECSFRILLSGHPWMGSELQRAILQ
jgi:hypothetical protein